MSDDGRRRILEALRAAGAPAVPAPDLGRAGVGVRFDDLAGQLALAVAAVGGRLQRVEAGTLAGAVAALAAELGTDRIGSAVDGVRGTVDLAAVRDPHDLEGLGLAVLPGAFAVAENGAVWLRGDAFAPRASFVVAEHLALAVPAAEIVPDMHEAYRRIAFPGAGFGTFIAGPSKTADIEQALVIGAHGARSCTVLLVD